MVLNCALLLSLSALAPAPPTMPAVLDRATAYVAEFERVLQAIVADETYVQHMRISGRSGEFIGTTHRTLKSDLLLIRGTRAGYTEVRDVYEVDGRTVSDRSRAFESWRSSGVPASVDDTMRLRHDNAAFDLGDIVRTINTPLMALQILRRSNRDRFTFRPAQNAAAAIGVAADDIPGVFRLSTEAWVITFREHGGGTLIRTAQGRDIPCSGRFWIEPDSGRILMTEIVAESREVRAQMTVSFKSEPLLGLQLPVEMREFYRSKTQSATRIETAATYGTFQVIPVK